GGYYWNSGMFAFSARTMVRELRAHAPEIGRRLRGSLAEMRSDFRSMPDISLDYAVMERSPKAAVIPMSVTWSDLGSWDSLQDIADKDRDGNIRIGDVIDMDTRNSIFVGGKRLITAVGVRDIIAVDTEDALLLIKRGSAQRVRDVVDLLKSRRRGEVAEHTTAYRPWGNYSVLDEGPRYRIKRIKIKPGGKVSLQRHHHRSEHWVVLKGTARVMIDGKESLLHENESGYVPKSAFHRLENPGRVTLELIEVQNGEYVGEDDIIRLEGERALPRARGAAFGRPWKTKKR
ncbi:MAG TPA: cupin domain-containing protein, partial [Elusimicrobiales bacterium]|nr:cupin domain-containing protein [Elusimicrobiales bacterium]